MRGGHKERGVRLEQNLKGTEVTLTEEEMTRLQGIDKNHRLFSVSSAC